MKPFFKSDPALVWKHANLGELEQFLKKEAVAGRFTPELPFDVGEGS